MEKNRDKTISLLRICTKDRQELDDPAYKPNIFYGEIAADFNNTKLLFDVPANKHKIVGHEDLSANDFRRINILRTGKWIMKVQGTWVPKYGAMMKSWTQGTGGGSGAPENYNDWKKRDDEYLNEYSQTRCITYFFFFLLFFMYLDILSPFLVICLVIFAGFIWLTGRWGTCTLASRGW